MGRWVVLLGVASVSVSCVRLHRGASDRDTQAGEQRDRASLSRDLDRGAESARVDLADRPVADRFLDKPSCKPALADATVVPPDYPRCVGHAAYGGLVWPTAADVAGPCVDFASQSWPVVGPGAANWFNFGCGMIKQYPTYAGCALLLRSEVDCCPTCALKEINYRVEQKSSSGWKTVLTVKYPPAASCADLLIHDDLYVPSSPSVSFRVVAQGNAGFYLCVFPK